MSSNCVKWASHAAETKRKELKPTDSSVGTESALISVYSLIPWDRALELLIKALALLLPVTHSLSCSWVRPRDRILADGIELEAMCPFGPSRTLPWLFPLTLCRGQFPGSLQGPVCTIPGHPPTWVPKPCGHRLTLPVFLPRKGSISVVHLGSTLYHSYPPPTNTFT